MATFARNGNKVLFIENTGIRTPGLKDLSRIKKRIISWRKGIRGFRQELDNLYVYSPLILPFPYSKIARYINKHLVLDMLEKWFKIMDFYNPIIWTFLPTGITLDLIDNIRNKAVVYYCIADFYALAGNYEKVKKTEDELIRKCDLIFTQGEALRDKCIRFNKNVHIFPFGVNSKTFDNFIYNPDRVPKSLKGVKRPIIGYLGGVHKHIDFKLIKLIAERYQDYSIVLVGPVQTNIHSIEGLSNVYILGKKEFESLPYFLYEFDVCIIPYLKTEYTATVYPTKLNEYHALGKPVVSTDLSEVINFNKAARNLVYIANTHGEFIKQISVALSESNNKQLQVARVASSKKNNWSNRIHEMSNIMESTMLNKPKRTADWKVSFLQTYRKTRRKMPKIILLISCCYILLFYTPLVWFLANPLKISQAPERADCIVVFSGGVGESGKAGQGYEERVQYAVDLYRSGFANHLLFSSGYKLIFEEAQLMKIVALAQGIPEKSIITEDKATNTYENVKFVKEILDEQKWNTILFVSSPYHMLRSSLVFKKNAPELKVTYTPIPKSSFYKHSIYSNKSFIGFHKQIQFKQLKGILHEYLGIIYYYIKGLA